MDRDKFERKRQRFEARLERRRSRHSGRGGLGVGIVMVVAGLVLLLDNLGVLEARDLWRYWPVALIVLGASRIVETRRPAAILWGSLMASVGVVLLLRNLDLFWINFSVLWPLAIIAVGVSMLLRGVDRGRAARVEQSSPTPELRLYAVFSGCRRRVDSKDFSGGEAFVMFGGCDIDLRGAQMPGGRAVFDFSSLFGNCEVIVPDSWRVTWRGVGIPGGFDNRTVPPRPVEGMVTPELVITGTILFGVVSVRN